MTNIDQFESVFKAADKPQFAPETVQIEAVTVVTDLDADAAQAFQRRVREFLGEELAGRVQLITGGQFASVDQLLEQIDQTADNIVCTHRNLHIHAREHPYSLGVYVDVLTQATRLPVMLLPNPHDAEQTHWWQTGRDSVMVMTDHLTGDHHLVSFAAALTSDSGKLYLTHVEDEAAFERFIDAIARVPAIDTDTARHEILEQLLKQPHDYIRSCREVLRETANTDVLEEIVTLGHHLADYKRLVVEHDIDLLVFNTKDEEQLAMHGLSYPLAVELRETPLLML